MAAWCIAGIDKFHTEWNLRSGEGHWVARTSMGCLGSRGGDASKCDDIHNQASSVRYGMSCQGKT